jgi:hypothetical protein
VTTPVRPVAAVTSWFAVPALPVKVPAMLNAKPVMGETKGKTRARTAEISGVMRARASMILR